MFNSGVDINGKNGTITIVRRAEIAQLVEHLTENQGVPSSSLGLGTSPRYRPEAFGRFLFPLKIMLMPKCRVCLLRNYA